MEGESILKGDCMETKDDFTRTWHGECLALGRLLNVTEDELLQTAKEVQPKIEKLEDMTINTYYYVTGRLMGRQRMQGKARL